MKKKLVDAKENKTLAVVLEEKNPKTFFFNERFCFCDDDMIGFFLVRENKIKNNKRSPLF